MKTNAVILDLLRTFGTRGTSVQDITETGALFNISENTIRVNLSRLATKKLIEPVKRGHYRLCQNASSVNEFAESWRLGESRVKPWLDNHWICINLAKTDDKSKWALTNYGFRPIIDGFWLRPANLTLRTADLVKRLKALGLTKSAICTDGAQLVQSDESAWINCFDLDALENTYQQTRLRLEASLERLPAMARDEAKRESFALGGAAIEVLAKDPLVPEQYLSPVSREALWTTLMAYDQTGRQIWATPSQTPDALVTPNSQLMAN